MRMICASGNQYKVEEFQGLMTDRIDGETIEIHSARAVGGMPDVDENADTFTGNARLKAEALAFAAAEQNAWVLADDSGLAVDFLEGAPGVYSARYAGPHATDTENVEKLLGALAGVEPSKRVARFVCALWLIGPDSQTFVAEGFCKGRIAETPLGDSGFGYDPVFIPEGFTQTFGELGDSLKQKLSHRAKAVAELVSLLRS